MASTCAVWRKVAADSQSADLPDAVWAMLMRDIDNGVVIARLVVDGGSENRGDHRDEIETPARSWAGYDFFFFTSRRPIATARTVTSKERRRFIEHLDHLLPDILALKPNVLVVTGESQHAVVAQGPFVAPAAGAAVG